jgi:hypothetical protein
LSQTFLIPIWARRGGFYRGEMPDRGSNGGRGPERDDPVEELRGALERAEKAVERERRRSRKWEREAVFRASTVAGQLAGQILAAQRLANAVERHLGCPATADPESAAIREALIFYQEARNE